MVGAGKGCRHRSTRLMTWTSQACTCALECPAPRRPVRRCFCSASTRLTRSFTHWACCSAWGFQLRGAGVGVGSRGAAVQAYAEGAEQPTRCRDAPQPACSPPAPRGTGRARGGLSSPRTAPSRRCQSGQAPGARGGAKAEESGNAVAVMSARAGLWRSDQQGSRASQRRGAARCRQIAQIGRKTPANKRGQGQ